jgi:hypothetical protein
VFGIEFDANNVRFDVVPASVLKECSELRNHYVEAWVYGHLKTEDTEYFIVDGYVKIESEDHPGTFTTVQEDGSFVIELRAGKCLVDPSPYVFFPELVAQGKNPKPKIQVTDQVLDAIWTELLQRYAKAFGGKRAFLRRIQKINREDLPHGLRGQLETFEKDAADTH